MRTEADIGRLRWSITHICPSRLSPSPLCLVDAKLFYCSTPRRTSSNCSRSAERAGSSGWRVSLRRRHRISHHHGHHLWADFSRACCSSAYCPPPAWWGTIVQRTAAPSKI